MKLRKSSFNKILESKNFKKIELPQVVQSKNILKRSGETFRKYMFSFYDKKNLSGNTTKVKTYLLDTLIKKTKKNPDLIRMDVEGHEVEILNSIINSIKNGAKVEIILPKNYD